MMLPRTVLAPTAPLAPERLWNVIPEAAVAVVLSLNSWNAPLKEAAAFTVNILLLLLLPSTALPRALNTLPAATVTAALAVTAALEVKTVTAVTVSVCPPAAVPNTVLPLAVSSPATVTAALAVMAAVADIGAVAPKVVAA